MVPVGRIGLAIEEVHAAVVEAAAGVVVDQVEKHRDAMEMEEVDEAFQLVDAGSELGGGERRAAAGEQQGVGGRQVALVQLAARRHLVLAFGREVVGAVVAQAELGRILLDRQQHHRVDAQVAQVLDAIERVEEAGHLGAAVLAAGVDAIEGPHVQLIDDEIAEIGRTESAVVPRVAPRIAHQAQAGGKPGIHGQLAGAGITLEPRAALAVDPVEVRRAVGDAGHEARPGAVAERRQGRPRGPRSCRGGGQARGHHLDLAGARRPQPEGGACRREVGAHRGRGIDSGWTVHHRASLPPLAR